MWNRADDEAGHGGESEPDPKPSDSGGDERLPQRTVFEGEKGAVNWGRAESRRKRCYQTLRIPESVMLRVYQRIRKAG